MKKRVVAEGLITPQALGKKAGVSIHQVNDYIRRGLLRITKYEKHTRCLAEPPSSQIVMSIKKHLEKSGSLSACEKDLKTRYPAYYDRA